MYRNVTFGKTTYMIIIIFLKSEILKEWTAMLYCGEKFYLIAFPGSTLKSNAQKVN